MVERRPATLSGYAAAALCAVGAAVVYARQAAYRSAEARVEAFLVNGLSPVRTVAMPHTATVYTGFSASMAGGMGRVMGFTITPECSSAVLVGGFLALTAIALASRRWSWPAVSVALAVAVVVVVVANLVRLSVVIWATRVWNRPGYEWSHVYVGTFITLFGLVVALIAYLMLLGVGPHTARSLAARTGSDRAP